MLKRYTYKLCTNELSDYVVRKHRDEMYGRRRQ